MQQVKAGVLLEVELGGRSETGERPDELTVCRQKRANFEFIVSRCLDVGWKVRISLLPFPSVVLSRRYRRNSRHSVPRVVNKEFNEKNRKSTALSSTVDITARTVTEDKNKVKAKENIADKIIYRPRYGNTSALWLRPLSKSRNKGNNCGRTTPNVGSTRIEQQRGFQQPERQKSESNGAPVGPLIMPNLGTRRKRL